MSFKSSTSRRTAVNILLSTAALGAASLAGTGRSFGQSWPARTIRIISPISAGSIADGITRTVSEPVSQQLGRPIVVENRPGGEGTIAPAAVARAEADGYTLLSHSSALTVVATTHAKLLPFDTAREFSGITGMAEMSSVLIIGASKNVKTIDELVKAARKSPMNFASPGAFTHLNTERFMRAAGFKAQRIPFKGTPEALTEIVAGRVDFYFSPVLAALPLINAGNLVPLAVTGTERLSWLPKVPSLAEAGLPKVFDNFWVGLFAPAQTPRDIVNRLNEEAVRALRSPAVVERLAKLGTVPMPTSPEEFDAIFRGQIADNAKLIKEVGIAVN
jgi:tripartite-type tricarboxylate transporter receptor subunit TctC